jgi:transcriptional regulator with XRE-family HTH domain
MQLAMEHANIGRQEMANRMDCHRNTISNWLSGNTRPRHRDLRAWAQVCDVDLEWLVSGTVTDNQKYGDDETDPLRALAQTNSYRWFVPAAA